MTIVDAPPNAVLPINGHLRTAPCRAAAENGTHRAVGYNASAAGTPAGGFSTPSRGISGPLQVRKPSL